MADAPKILGTDSLRSAYPKLNMMVDLVNDFQTQINEIVVTGDSSIEAAQARVTADGNTFTTLKERLDDRDVQLADVEQHKASKEEARLKSVKLEPEDLSEETLGLVTGTGSVNLLTIPQKSSVSYEKTDFVKTGKNLFDKSKRLIGMVVSDTNGSVSSDLGTGYDTSDYIPVLGGVTYYINKVRKYALYNSNKSYVSGNNNTAYGSAIFTPSVDGFLRFYVGQSFVDITQLEVGTSGTAYEPFKYKSEKFSVDSTNLDVDVAIKKKTKNLLDISKITSGYYVSYSNGSLVANADNKVTDFILLEPNTTYTLSSQTNGDLSQLAFYNNSKAYVSGLPNSGVQKSVTFTTASNVFYLRLSIPTSINDGVMLEKGSVMNEYEPYGSFIDAGDLPKELSGAEKVIKVKQDGTGDFTSLRVAVESTEDSSKTNPYTIEIYEGTYDVFGYYTTAELNNASFDGLRIPDYVSLKGIGDKKKIILRGFLPDDEVNVTFESHGRISTICPLGSGNIENITVEGKNLRYAVHDDYNYTSAKKFMKNCDFIRYKGNGKNYGGKQAWGEGSWSGQSYIFEDCYFFTEWEYYAYTSHNNINFTEPSYHKFINCKFFTTKGSASLRLESLGSGKKELAELIGCKINASIDLTYHASNTTGVIDHDLKGYGNDIVPVKILNGDGEQYTYEFVGETQEMYNGGATSISKGQPVMLDSSGISIVPFIGDGKIRYFGVAMEDILTGASGIVKTGGYLAISDTALTGLAVGDLVGITNGALTKVTTGDYIGVVTLTDYIRLV